MGSEHCSCYGKGEICLNSVQQQQAHPLALIKHFRCVPRFNDLGVFDDTLGQTSSSSSSSGDDIVPHGWLAIHHQAAAKLMMEEGHINSYSCNNWLEFPGNHAHRARAH